MADRSPDTRTTRGSGYAVGGTGSDRLPVDPTTGQPMPPRAQPGYYPGYRTVSQQAFWDAATRRVVLPRLESPPPLQFFTPDEARLMEAICDRMVPQDDRDDEHKIPIVPTIDARLFSGRIDGYRFDNMPPDAEAYRLALRGIDDVARHLHGHPFVELGPLEQDDVLWKIHDDQPPPEVEVWRHLPAERAWSLLLQDAIEGYYQHPYAWDEIGFGGPAYPRGYMRLERGEPEPWEVEEQRYAWSPPPTSTSGEYRPLGGEHSHKHPPAGQEGTH